jgi:hypothetical protein
LADLAVKSCDFVVNGHNERIVHDLDQKRPLARRRCLGLAGRWNQEKKERDARRL